MALEDTLGVYTTNNPEELLIQGYTGDWRINAPRVARLAYVMVVSKQPYERGAVKFIAKIKNFKRIDAPGEYGRFRFFFDEFIPVETVTINWTGQWPTKFMNSEDLAVNVNDASLWKTVRSQKRLVVSKYARELAKELGVAESAVTITVDMREPIAT